MEAFPQSEAGSASWLPTLVTEALHAWLHSCISWTRPPMAVDIPTAVPVIDATDRVFYLWAGH